MTPSPIDRIRVALAAARQGAEELEAQTGMRALSARAHLGAGIEALERAEAFLLAASSGYMSAVRESDR